jgi:hypothetical protein
MTLPLIILGGRDRRGTTLPAAGQDKERLKGYKGADLRIGGRPLIAVAIDRWRQVGFFDPIFVAGPRAIYQDLVDPSVRLIDTDGELGENLRAVVERIVAEKLGQVATTTCDILPDPAELSRVIADLDAHQPVDFFMPLARVPADEAKLGASDWKPKYWVKPDGERDAVPILPGHLIVGNLEELRVRFIYLFFDQLYRTRNRSVTYRRVVITRSLLGSLLREDLKHLFSLRLPHITFTVVLNALLLASRLAAGSATTKDFENRLRYVFLRRGIRLAHPGRRGRIPVLNCLSLAKDIDTVEEALEVSAAVERGPLAGC